MPPLGRFLKGRPELTPSLQGEDALSLASLEQTKTERRGPMPFKEVCDHANKHQVVLSTMGVTPP